MGKCEVVFQFKDKSFEVARFDAEEGECLNRACEIARGRGAKYITCSRLKTDTDLTREKTLSRATGAAVEVEDPEILIYEAQRREDEKARNEGRVARLITTVSDIRE